MSPTALEGTDPEVSQHCQILPIHIKPSSPSIQLSSEMLPVVVVPDLLILAEVYPEHLNRPGEGKDHLCCLCSFRHSNMDAILMHIRKHLEVVVGCPCLWERISKCGLAPQTMVKRFPTYRL